MLAIVALALLLGSDADEFRRHPGERALRGSPARPDVRAQPARRYRTVLREEAAAGPNFNGHYRVASWGCGTNCIGWAVIDLESGAVWMAPKPAFSCWAPNAAEDTTLDWFAMRKDSSLLYLHTCEPQTSDKTFNRRSVYVWSGKALKLLRREPL